MTSKREPYDQPDDNINAIIQGKHTFRYSELENGLFIFRRDLRTIDNVGLSLLSDLCKKVYTVFIFTPEQVGKSNEYKSDHAVQYMIETLTELSEDIAQRGGHLITCYGSNIPVIRRLIEQLDIQVVAFNLDITPYARERDTEIIQLCEKKGVLALCENDYYLNPIGSVLNGSGDPYQKFTPYYENARKRPVPSPQSTRSLHLKHITKRIDHSIPLREAMSKFVKPRPNENLLVRGGRKSALTQLKHAVRTLSHYGSTHNDLTKPTTELSAAIKFGCVSIREVYHSLRGKTELIRQLYWRDFYANIMCSFPRVIGRSLKPNYDKISWKQNDAWLRAWKRGETGFPIVDAGMRQMNQSGYMHNRARLIVASFLVKTLLIDWREGEKYFAQTLTDYDVANNNGNWQWISGGGADSQPYFRVFNPWNQGKEYDPKCEYIKQWVPELKDIPPKDIHQWHTKWEEYISPPSRVDYIKPICDYVEQKEKVLQLYKSAFR